MGGENEAVDRVSCATGNWLRNCEHREGQCRGVLQIRGLSHWLCRKGWRRAAAAACWARGCARSSTAWNTGESWRSGRSRRQALRQTCPCRRGDRRRLMWPIGTLRPRVSSSLGRGGSKRRSRAIKVCSLVGLLFAATALSTIPVSPQLTPRGVELSVDQAQAVTYRRARVTSRRVGRRDYRQTRRAVRRSYY